VRSNHCYSIHYNPLLLVQYRGIVELICTEAGIVISLTTGNLVILLLLTHVTTFGISLQVVNVSLKDNGLTKYVLNVSPEETVHLLPYNTMTGIIMFEHLLCVTKLVNIRGGLLES